MCSTSCNSCRVEFQPEGRPVSIMRGAGLIEAAGEADIIIETPCGGAGTCGKCRVRVTQGAPEPSDSEKRHLTAAELKGGVRLACRTRVQNDMTVTVPTAARYAENRILTNGSGRQVALQASVEKRFVELAKPDLADQRSDADRLLAALGGSAQPGISALRDLPQRLRESDFRVTVAIAEGEVIAVEPGDTVASNLGVAFDIGTTTIVGYLLDLVTGREIAVAAAANPQAAYGHDVISRIKAASRPEGLVELQRCLIEKLNDLIAECCRKAGVRSEQLYEATLVGNTTMSHLFLGINPAYLAQAPYVAAHTAPVNLTAREANLAIHPHGRVHVLPNIAGFVGSDTVGVILASGMHESADRQLTIDIGTNGEIVVGDKERLLAASTAAGPAFEGAKIGCGMRAAEGAIEKIVFDGDIRYNVIGDVPPKGICGTALIDLVAELLRLGALEPTGRLLGPGEMPEGVPETLKKRVIRGASWLEVVIVPAAESATGAPITLTQRDIREVQLAKGAIAAGATILLRERGYDVKYLKHILLAGAFGNFIRRGNALRIGLLPDAPHEKILFIGNAAGAGARMALLSRQCKKQADEIARRVEYVELAGRSDFQEAFAEAMMFPER